MRAALFLVLGVLIGGSGGIAQAVPAKKAKKIQFNCTEVFGFFHIPVCTDLVSPVNCNPKRLLKAGQRWQDEFQFENMQDATRNSDLSCVSDFSEVTTGPGCCGG